KNDKAKTKARFREAIDSKPEFRGIHGKRMSIAFEQDGQLRRKTDASAANDDHLGLANAANRAQKESATSESGGWDAYDVWRRFIKDARDRRAGITFPQ